MKPNPQEKQWLQDYLYQTMTYQEAYLEIYDHILSSLKHEPEQKFFESTINSVISNDFGGYDALHLMEENGEDVLGTEVKKQYLFNLYQWVKFPLLICTTIVFACTYYSFTHSVLVVPILFLFMLLVPIISIKIIGFTFGHTKKSIKYPVFRKIINRATKSYFICSFIIFQTIAIIRKAIDRNNSDFSHALRIIGNCVFSIMVTFLIVHALSLIKTYKFKFNTSIIVNNTKTSQCDDVILT